MRLRTAQRRPAVGFARASAMHLIAGGEAARRSARWRPSLQAFGDRAPRPSPVSPSTLSTTRLPSRVMHRLARHRERLVGASPGPAARWRTCRRAARRRGLPTRTSIRKWRLRSSTSGAMAARRPLNVSPGLRLHGHRGGKPELQPARFELRHAGFELQSRRRSATTTTGRSPGMAPAS